MYMQQINKLIFVLSMLLSSTAFAQTPVARNGQLQVIGLKLCNQYGNPIQLRGMSTHGIQWYGWGSCLTEASLDALAYDWGADILRISLYVQEGGYETNPSGFTAQVNRLVEEATERGMYALIDWHQLDPGDPNANLSRARTFFTAVANAHKDKNNVIYDICNEPNGVSWNQIKSYADQIIPVIRAIDNNAVILIGTHGWASFGVSDGRTAQDIVNNPVTFPNIMYTFHFYARSHQQAYYDQLNWASDRLPVFVTEFGTQEYTGDGPNDFNFSQRYIDLLRTKKISWTNWNYSDDFRSGAVWTTGTCANGPWTTARLKPAGAWIRERMLTPADDFPGGGTPACEPVTASTHDGNVPSNVLDNDYNTRWSASGDGQWIQFCLNTSATVTGVDIAFYQGNTRRALFDIQTSTDGNSWVNASTGLQSSGTSNALEAFNFASRTAKYVRIVGHGNTASAWNSYTEVRVKTASSLSGSKALAISENKAANQQLDIKAYPNPFRGNISVAFHLKEASFTTLGIYDMSGKLVSPQISERLPAGSHNKTLQAGNIPAGTYMLKVVHNGQVSTKKLAKQ
jgi:endoglucanase